MESITWTGSNWTEFEAFSYRSNFGYFAGSNFYNYKWYHRLYDKVASHFEYLPEWEPPDDPTVLEVYFIQTRDRDHYWTTMKVGDSIDIEGNITRGTG